ncbi:MULTISPECIES: serine/threonine-protein kinase [Streptomyces]
MGRVWRAADEMLDRQVAVKEMRIDGLDPEDSRTRRERTLREARATARIDHPNVVRIYDVVDEGERLWIVMELVAGRSLEQMVVEDGPIGPREAARIGLELVAALRQVHAGGVLHRDIKPGNVLVERRGNRVVLTDFGIAALQDAEALTMAGMLVGSPDYMAPERVSGRPQGPPSDVWSLGATLCAALGGRSPFSRATTLATLHAVLYEEPELPSTAGELRDILAALLEKEPEARPGLEELEGTLGEIAFPAAGPQPELGPGSGSISSAQEEPASAAPVAPEVPEASDAFVTPELLATPEVPAAPKATVTPEAPDAHQAPEAHQELPTPALLDADLIRAIRQPSQAPQAPQDLPEAVPPSEEPRPERAPKAVSEPEHAPKAVPETIPTPNASTEVPSELRAEAGSEIPSAGTPGATTEVARRPTAPAPIPVMPPGELPGPAVPSAPRRSRRRTGLATAGGVVAAGLVAWIVIAATSGSPDGKTGSSGSSVPTASAGTKGSPSPTVEGTSRPPSPPPGAHREAGGYAWVTPKGWRRDLKTGSEVHYTSPDGKQELAAKSSLAKGDLMQTWQTSERNARQGRDYQKIRLENTTFQGRPAVVWEYTFTLKGVHYHAQLLGFDVDGKSYQINTWYEPDIESQALKVYEQVRRSFTVL